MKSFLNRFLLPKISKSHVAYKKIIVCNYIAFWLSISSLPYIIIFYYINILFSVGVGILILLYLVIIIINNKFNFFNLGRIYFITLVSIATFLYAVSFGYGIGIQNMFFILVPLFFIISDYQEVKLQKILILIPIILTALYLIINLRISNTIISISIFYTKVIYSLFFCSILFLSYKIISFFAKLYQKTNDELVDKNKALKQANQEIEETTKIKTEYNIARDIQSKFLPKTLPQVNNFKFDYAYFPSRQVSGDFFDVHVYGKDIIGFIIFDVVGKGLAASFITIKLHTLFHSVIKDNLSAKGMLAFLNKEMGSLDIKMKNSVCFYMQLNLKTKVITYADTGIGVCYHIRGHHLQELRDAGGFPLGALTDAEYTENTLQLQPGDTVVVGTDGIIDTANQQGEKFGEKRLVQCLKQLEFKSDRTATIQLTEVLKSYAQKLNLNGLEDDITWFTIEYQA